MAIVVVASTLMSCRSAGPYGYSRTYATTSDEAHAVAGKPEFEARNATRGSTSWLFAVVTHRAAGPGGAAYLGLSLRALSPQNQCPSSDEDSCRVTVSDHETGRAHALLVLGAEDDLGEKSIGIGSLVRVVGTVTQDVDPSDGTPVLRASFYRHWPRGFYTAAKPASPSPKR